MADTNIRNWEGIYQLETRDIVSFGPDGVSNIQAKQLSARTQDLKDFLDEHTHDQEHFTKEEFLEVLDSYIKSKHTHDSEYTSKDLITVYLRGFGTNMPVHTHDSRYYSKEEFLNILDTIDVSSHTHDTLYPLKWDVQAALDTKSNEEHTHEDRYYTHTEISALLDSKSNSSHNHDTLYPVKLYVIDSIDTAPYSEHTHDDYATLSEISIEFDKHQHTQYAPQEYVSAELSSKADTAHTHAEYTTKEDFDSRLVDVSEEEHDHNSIYYTKGDVDSLLTTLAIDTHTHTEYASIIEVDDALEDTAPNDHNHIPTWENAARLTMVFDRLSGAEYLYSDFLSVGVGYVDTIITEPIVSDTQYYGSSEQSDTIVDSLPLEKLVYL